jgi:hypothetical protein
VVLGRTTSGVTWLTVSTTTLYYCSGQQRPAGIVSSEGGTAVTDAQMVLPTGTLAIGARWSGFQGREILLWF